MWGAPSSSTAFCRSRRLVGLDRVGLVVGEVAVELEVERGHLQRESLEHRRDGVPAHAVARVHDHPERPDAGHVDQPAQMGGVPVEQVAPDHLALAAVDPDTGLEQLGGAVADLGEPGVGSHWLRRLRGTSSFRCNAPDYGWP